MAIQKRVRIKVAIRKTTPKRMTKVLSENPNICRFYETVAKTKIEFEEPMIPCIFYHNSDKELLEEALWYLMVKLPSANPYVKEPDYSLPRYMPLSLLRNMSEGSLETLHEDDNFLIEIQYAQLTSKFKSFGKIQDVIKTITSKYDTIR